MVSLASRALGGAINMIASHKASLLHSDLFYREEEGRGASLEGSRTQQQSEGSALQPGLGGLSGDLFSREPVGQNTVSATGTSMLLLWEAVG